MRVLPNTFVFDAYVLFTITLQPWNNGGPCTNRGNNRCCNCYLLPKWKPTGFDNSI